MVVPFLADNTKIYSTLFYDTVHLNANFYKFFRVRFWFTATTELVWCTDTHSAKERESERQTDISLKVT